MKRTLTELAALLAVTMISGTASAQAPTGAPIYGPGYAGAGAGAPTEEVSTYQKQYGLHPGLKRLIPKGKLIGSHGCGFGHRIGGKLGAKLGSWVASHASEEPPPAVQGGTLAFPNHPFVRSPRDFFMLDQ